jgi:hypothetical protein
MKIRLPWIPMLVLLVTASACAHQPRPMLPDPPGFFLGLLHGFLMLFSLIGSIFTDVRIYAFPNSGFGYDLGFLIGASSFLGGGARGVCRRSSRTTTLR